MSHDGRSDRFLKHLSVIMSMYDVRQWELSVDSVSIRSAIFCRWVRVRLLTRALEESVLDERKRVMWVKIVKESIKNNKPNFLSIASSRRRYLINERRMAIKSQGNKTDEHLPAVK